MTAMSADTYAQVFALDLKMGDLHRPRSQQTTDGVIGISDLGGCAEYVRRLVVKAPKTDSPNLMSAIVGTWCDQGMKESRMRANPNLLLDVALSVTLPNGAVVPGTADEIDQEEPSVTDYKSKDGLSAQRRLQTPQQARWQRHNYAAAAIQAGIVPEEGLIVRNVYIDRSGKDETVHVEQEAFSWDVVNESSDWLTTQVLERVKDGEESSKDQPITFCKRYCAFFSSCRLGDVEIGPISIPELAAKVDLYAQAGKVEREAKAIKDDLRNDLEGVTGRTQTAALKSTWINSRGGYWRLEAETL